MTMVSLSLAGRGFSRVEDHTTWIARPPIDNRGRRQAFRQVSLAGVPTRRLLDDDESSAGVSESGRRRWHPSFVAHPLRNLLASRSGLGGGGISWTTYLRASTRCQRTVPFPSVSTELGTRSSMRALWRF